MLGVVGLAVAMAVDQTTPDPYPLIGHIVEGKYEIQQILGSGAMGRVVRAHHVLRKIPVALKFVSPALLGHRDVVERFLNEGVASSKIDSEHVVKVYDVSTLPNGLPYMVMELLEGQDLSRLLRREGRPFLDDPARAVHFILQILRGLQAAHRVGIVHRDMKPANCFVIQKDGEPDFIKIVDFGISKVRADGGLELTQATSALGTPLYMSLEQAKSARDVDARTDLYSTAVILYELLAGSPPFVPDSDSLMELFSMLMNEDPKPLDQIRNDLPHGLYDVILKGLAKDREKRFQTAEDMAEALAPFADHRSDHVVSRLLRTAPLAPLRSRPPPSISEAPSVRIHTDTVLMTGAPSGAITRGALPVTARQESSPEVSTGQAVAQSQRTILEERRGTPLVFAIAVVAVAAVAAAAWALGSMSSKQAQEPVVTTGPAASPSSTPVAPAPSPSPPPSAAPSATAPPPTSASVSASVLPKAPQPAGSATGKQKLNDLKPDK